MGKKNKKQKAGRGASSDTVQKLPPDYQEAFQRAVHFHRRGQYAQADQIYQAILKDFPSHADSWHLLGVLASALNKQDVAVELIRKAISLNPRVADYFYNLGIAYHACQQYEKSIEAFRGSLRLKPSNAVAYENLGAACQDAGNYDQALQAYRRALELNPRSVKGLLNLGTLSYQRGATQVALDCFNRALNVSPAEPELHGKRFSALMRMGNFADGWPQYEWRFNTSGYRSSNPVVARGVPRWGGDDLSGKRVLVGAEQGIGDEVMFSLFFPHIIKEAKECVLECDARLASLYARSFPDAHGIVERGKKYHADIELVIPAGSYPSYRNAQADIFTHQANVLIADESRKLYWRKMLDGLEPKSLNIGITWQGGVDRRAVKARSATLKAWQRLFMTIDANFINLQYGDHQAEIDDFNKYCENPLQCFDELDAFNDIEGLCALIDELDLVISVDNATVHFAGALGKPVWILLPVGAEWRWLEERDDTLWYPRARLFRKQHSGAEGWDDVLADVEIALIEAQASLRDTPLKRENGKSGQFTPILDAESGSENRCLLLNDTSNWYHWGCSCTSISIYRALRDRHWRVEGLPIHFTNQLAGLPESIEAFDSEEQFKQFCHMQPELIARLQAANLILINGEGTLHSMGAAPVGLLYLAYTAKQKLGKSVAIINHSCYPNDLPENQDNPVTELYKTVYRVLDYVAAREPVSHGLLNEMGIRAQLSFDCLPLFIERYFEFDNIQREDRSILVCGSVGWGPAEIANVAGFVSLLNERGYTVKVLVGAAAYMASDDVEFVRQLQQHAADKFELIYAKSESEWLSTIATSALLVSGRFHHSIAAAFLGTPFLVSQSNTPKIDGLLQSLELSSPLFQVADISGEELLTRAEACLANPEPYLITEQTRERLLARSALNFPNFLSQ